MKPLTSDLQLRQIEIQGYKSIENCKIELGALNVIIGANGAGKSNFLSIFNLIKSLVNENLQEFILKKGGIESFLHYGSKNTTMFILRLFHNQFIYEVTFSPTSDVYTTIAESLSALDDKIVIVKPLTSSDSPEIIAENNSSNEYPNSADITKIKTNLEVDFLPVGNRGYESMAKSMLNNLYWESQMSDNPLIFKPKIETKHIVQSLVKTMDQYRVYHFNDTSETALIKRHCQSNDNIYFRTDGSNLAAFLYLLQEVHPKSYSQIVDTIKLATPFFSDFLLRPEPKNEEIIKLEWLEKGQDKPFKAFQLSDGTLRFICLVTLLLQPDKYLPQTIVIDEPELGLNPYSIIVLGELIRSVAIKRQIIITTQSVEFLNEFDLEDVIVASRVHGKSEFSRLDAESLSAWLEDYSLGELWQKNILGELRSL